MKCNICGETNLEYDSYRGATVCTKCGEVLEEGRVVNELSFLQAGDGRASVSGQRVAGYSLGGSGSERLGAFWNSSGVAISGQAALSTTLQRGGMRVEWIGQRLGLRNHVVDEGKRMFQLAAQRNFTTGRKTSHVAGACLYIVCRRDREPYLLLDFADALHASVRELGQIYMKLVRLLNLDKVLDIPVVDPSLFMERFSAKLELGQKGAQIVSHTAARLIQAMSRHWICTGRRPTGLCGAALLISCKYHGFERSPTLLAEIVRIGEVTIRKRLMELQQTPTAALTVDQFEAIEDYNVPSTAEGGSIVTVNKQASQSSLSFGYESLPPSLIRNREKERKLFLKGISPNDGKTPVFELSDACAELPTEDQIVAVANSMMNSLGGDSGLKKFFASFSQDDEVCLDLHATELSDTEDSEDLDSYILTEEESAAKSAIWHEWNKPFLEEWAMRDAALKRKQAESSSAGSKRSSAAIGNGSNSSSLHESALAATQEVIEKKAKTLVNKVNVDLIDSLFRKD